MNIEKHYIHKFMNEAKDLDFQEILDLYMKKVDAQKKNKSKAPILVEVNHMEKLLAELSGRLETTKPNTYSLTVDDLRKIPTGSFVIRDGHDKWYTLYTNNGNGYFGVQLLDKGSLGGLRTQSGQRPSELPSDGYIMELPKELDKSWSRFFIPDARKL